MADELISCLRRMVEKFEDADQHVNQSLSAFLEASGEPTKTNLRTVFWESFIENLKLAAEIQAELADYSPVVSADPYLKKKLGNISRKKGYKTFDIERVLLEGEKHETLLGEKELEEVFGDYSFYVFDILDTAKMGPFSDFLRRKILIAGLVVGNRNIEKISGFVQDVKNLYFLGQWRAAAILCRTLLETALRQRAKRDSSPDKVEELEKWTLDWLLPRVGKKYLSRMQFDRAKEINTDASDLVHGRKKAPQVTGETCLETIKDTFIILETLHAW
ncbi:MAG: hypothetical protein ACE5JS_22405 [Nitrospinota bacterium]